MRHTDRKPAEDTDEQANQGEAQDAAAGLRALFSERERNDYAAGNLSPAAADTRRDLTAYPRGSAGDDSWHRALNAALMGVYPQLKSEEDFYPQPWPNDDV